MPTDLIKLPGIGKKMVLMLNEIGIEEVADLRGKNPLELYEDTCDKRGERMDPCVLYTYRLAQSMLRKRMKRSKMLICENGGTGKINNIQMKGI